MRRYVPERSLPAEAYIPGRTRRPTESAAACGPRLTAQTWRTQREYLWGFDLWHNGFPWEAHEAWEGLWRALDRSSPEALILQALIKLAAADVKTRQGREASARAHTLRAIELMRQASQRAGEPALLGVDFQAFIDAIERGDKAAVSLVGL